MDEHEQGELVREWLRQNATSLIGGIAIGLAVILGWQWWQHGQSQHRVDASTTYHALNNAVDNGNATSIDQLAAELRDKYSDTPYGALGMMQLAKQKLAQEDLDGAESALVEAAKVSSSSAITALTHLRLARVQLAAGKADDALASLSKVPSGEFVGLVAEVRGDALMALGRTGEALDAYQDALTSLDVGAVNRIIVEMKLADLGAAPDEPGV